MESDVYTSHESCRSALIKQGEKTRDADKT
jgi:hypothetical protein